MKYLFLLMILPLLGYSQFKSNESGELEYELVVQADSLSSKQIHDKTAEWAALTYNDSKNVTKLDREDKIIINAQTDLNINYNGQPLKQDLKYSMIVAFKDGRYKIDFTELFIESKAGLQNTTQSVKDFKEMTLEDFKKMMFEKLDQYDESIKKPALKQYNKPGFLEEVFETSKELMSKTDSEIKSEIERISLSLQSYITKSGDNFQDDGW